MLTTSLIFSVVFFVAALLSALVGLAIRVHMAERVRLEFYGYPADYLETYKAALEKVTVAEVNAAAKKYVHPDKLALLVVGNGPEIKPGLDALNMGLVHTVDISIPQPGPEAGQHPGKAGQAEKPE